MNKARVKIWFFIEIIQLDEFNFNLTKINLKVYLDQNIKRRKLRANENNGKYLFIVI